MSTTYSAAVMLPAGFVVTASIEVSDEASYPDQGELSEVVQRAALGLVSAVDATTSRAPF